MTYFLIDMDNTIVDSHLVVETSWTTFAQDHGLDPAEVIAFCHGRPAVETATHFLGDLERAVEVAQAMGARETAISEGIVEVPGARDFVAAIPEGHWALVTSAPRGLATVRLQQIGVPAPSVMVCHEDITHGKPNPEPYLLGAQGLGADPSECIVMEDSTAGIASGEAAGCRVVVVGGNPAGGDRVVRRVDDLVGLRPSDLDAAD